MKKDKPEEDMRSEYDLKRLRVRRFGSERNSFGETTVRLEPDVAAVFDSADAVNEALRFLIKVTRDNQVNPTTEVNLSSEQTD